MPRRSLLAILAMLVVGTLLLTAVLPVAAQSEGRIIGVPDSFPTIEEAIAASQPGDVILVGAGLYPGGIVVPEDKPGITIRGVERNAVEFNGSNQFANAIEVEADNVTLENMTAHNYTANGFYWEGVDGFAGRYLTVWNVGLYGIYAIESTNGVIEQSYVSGAGDAAFYIGECYPCNTSLHDLTATLSAVGFSGTNASGNLVVEYSLFENNGVGILPNSFDIGLTPPPQRDAIFRGNVITGSGTVPVPRQTPLGGYHGIGIGIVGGVDNLVEQNQVTGSTRYGIVVVGAVDRSTTWTSASNQVNNNDVSGSGTADLALAAGSGAGNCFDDNRAATLDPPELAAACSVEGAGSPAVAAELQRPPPQLLEGLPAPPPYTDMPEPPDQETMLSPPPPDASNVGMIGIVTVIGFVGGIACIYAARPKNILDPKDHGNLLLRNAGAGLIVLGLVGLLLIGLLLLANR
jgi:parallel beta helix pectate lyase-like protein